MHLFLCAFRSGIGGMQYKAQKDHYCMYPPSNIFLFALNSLNETIGRFDGQTVKGTGAHYVDPKMRKSTDFPTWVKDSKEQLKGKRVMLYCTGGVR